MSHDNLDIAPNRAEGPELTVLAQALGLNETAGLSSIVAAIEGFRVLNEAETLEQVRRGLSLPLYADAIYCAADLCRRLPAQYGVAVVAAMFRIEVKERARVACVAEIQASALREPGASVTG